MLNTLVIFLTKPKQFNKVVGNMTTLILARSDCPGLHLESPYILSMLCMSIVTKSFALDALHFLQTWYCIYLTFLCSLKRHYATQIPTVCSASKQPSYNTPMFELVVSYCTVTSLSYFNISNAWKYCHKSFIIQSKTMVLVFLCSFVVLCSSKYKIKPFLVNL